jgi:site-specific DNA-methyltransferase (adenine-specific)
MKYPAPTLSPAPPALPEDFPTTHKLVQGDARNLSAIANESIHLVVTSPPYWTLKRYNDSEGQLGHVADYEQFVKELEKVWRETLRVLVPGGRLVCVVGDVCLSRRENAGRHTVVPLHADICVTCRRLGFDNLNPIIWHKISNASYEVSNGSKFLGKPYEPNAIIKNDIEYILMQRKPGGYRKPTHEQRKLSMIPKDKFDRWFQQFWTLSGASTKEHPAPFPLELASRLVQMFSFVGDTVLDPFCGTGTTMLAAMKIAGIASASNLTPSTAAWLPRGSWTKTRRSSATSVSRSSFNPQEPSRRTSPPYTRPRPPTRLIANQGGLSLTRQRQKASEGSAITWSIAVDLHRQVVPSSTRAPPSARPRCPQ